MAAKKQEKPAITKHHSVTYRNGGGSGVVKWTGQSGSGVWWGVVRWDSNGELQLVPLEASRRPGHTAQRIRPSRVRHAQESDTDNMSDDEGEPMFVCGKVDCGKPAYTSTFWCDDHDPLEERDRLRARVVELEKVILDCQEMSDAGVFHGKIVEHILTVCVFAAMKDLLDHDTPSNSEVKP